jgi:hypothetical protein
MWREIAKHMSMPWDKVEKMAMELKVGLLESLGIEPYIGNEQQGCGEVEVVRLVSIFLIEGCHGIRTKNCVVGDGVVFHNMEFYSNGSVRTVDDWLLST